MLEHTAFLAQISAVQAGAEPKSIWDFFLDASPVAKFILGLLVFLSLGSWGIIFAKLRQYRRAERAGSGFLQIFRGSKRFSEVNAAVSDHSASPLVGLFQAGYVEIDTQVKALQSKEAPEQGRYLIKSMAAIERSLRRAMQVETQVLTRFIPFLATTAAAAPFIGLFGTVWGIMIAFNEIGLSGSTSIVAVAPGIAEALINTAAGLAAAIPALVGYNYLSSKIRTLRSDMEDFVLEFVNLSERNFT